MSFRLLCIWFITFISGSFGFNVLMITPGVAGHVIPMFELVKAMKNHNVTLITEIYAQSYINFSSYSNSSLFRVIYTNNSIDALTDGKKMEKEMVEYFLNHSLLDSHTYLIPALRSIVNASMTKTIHMLMSERYDVIIGSSIMTGLHTLCKVANVSCVMQLAEKQLDIFNVNLGDGNLLLSSKQLTELKYRIYNFAFTLRFMVPFFKAMIRIYYAVFQSLPQIPGPFNDVFTLRNLLLTKTNYLKLYSLPPTLYPLSTLSGDTKYLGGFIDESSIEYVDNHFTRWIKSKPRNSIIYVAFGSISVVNLDRMKNLIYGLAEFLLQRDEVSVLLAFRKGNYVNYQMVLNEMKNDQYRRVLIEDGRVKVENEFLQQKWLLQQNSLALFISHCGMGSTVEALYFQKPLLCLPLCTDQFMNAIALYHSGVGESLFTPPSLLKSFLNPVDHHDYTFTVDDVTIKLLTMWRNSSYERAVRLMSLEMKYAGGVKRAVEEIELLINSNGNIDRYEPFSSTLPFYQRYILDIAFIFVVLPLMIVFYLCTKCCKRNRKEKKD